MKVLKISQTLKQDKAMLHLQERYMAYCDKQRKLPKNLQNPIPKKPNGLRIFFLKMIGVLPIELSKFKKIG